MAMHRMVGIGLAVGMGIFAGDSTGRAQDVGCCRAECRDGDRVRVMALNAVTAEDCRAQFAACTVSWEEGPCPEPHPGVPGGFGNGGEGSAPNQRR